MGNINFDPELVQYIQGLYGDADLDNRTLKQLYTLWQTNPQIIKNAYQQKVNTTPIISQNNSPIISQNNSLIESKAINTVPQRISKPEIADDDLSGISNFNDAFKVARQKGLTQFKWKSTKGNPSGLFGTELKTTKKPVISQNNLPIVKQEKTSLNVPMPSNAYFINKEIIIPNKTANKTANKTVSETTSVPESKSTTNSISPVQANISRYTMNNTASGDFGIGKFLKNTVSNIGDFLVNAWNTRESSARPLTLGYGHTTAYKQGGQLNSKEEMEKSIFAKMSSKLDYISLLNGRCPEGYEVEKFLKGGCVKCRKKAMETNIFENKCGGKAKKRISKNK